MVQVYRMLFALLLFSLTSMSTAAASQSIRDYSWLLYLMPINNEQPVIDPVVNNGQPVIDPVVNMEFNWTTDSVHLDATVADDSVDRLVYEWKLVSGPGEVEFRDPDAEDITAVFSRYGDYLLQLNVSNGMFTNSVELAVTFDFLHNYTNPAQLKLSSERVYPMGQKMMISAWHAQSIDELQELKDAGFTMQGPIPGTTYLSYLSDVSQIGLRAAHRLYTGSNSADASSLAQALKDPAERDAIVKRMETEILRVVENSEYNNVVDVWLIGCEELSTRGSDCDLNTSGNPSCTTWDSTYNEIWYLSEFQKAIEKHDPERRPLWMSDVIGTDKEQLLSTHQYLDMIGQQMYLERIDPEGELYPNFYKNNVIVRELVTEMSDAASELDKLYSASRLRPVTVSFGAFYEPPSYRNTEEFIMRHTQHDLYLALNSGLQGFQIYTWYNYKSITLDSHELYKKAYSEHVKLLTDNDLDDAYLWGERKDDLVLNIVSGPEFIDGALIDDQPSTNNQPSISSANIQYGENRFLILTNSASEPVGVSIGNIPDRCAKTLDILEGIYLPKTSTFTTTLPPLGVKLYRFDRDGDC